MGELQPGGTLVVKIGQRALLQPGVFSGGGHDRRLTHQRLRFGRDVFELVGRVDLRRQRLDPLRRIKPALPLLIEPPGVGNLDARTMALLRAAFEEGVEAARKSTIC